MCDVLQNGMKHVSVAGSSFSSSIRICKSQIINCQSKICGTHEHVHRLDWDCNNVTTHNNAQSNKT